MTHDDVTRWPGARQPDIIGLRHINQTFMRLCCIEHVFECRSRDYTP